MAHTAICPDELISMLVLPPVHSGAQCSDHKRVPGVIKIFGTEKFHPFYINGGKSLFKCYFAFPVVDNFMINSDPLWRFL